MKNMTIHGAKSLKSIGWIPVLNSKAGGCMTSASFREAGIGILSLHLTSLLMKPGYDFLKALPSFRDFFGWEGRIVLNATLPYFPVEDVYRLQSSFDGQRMCYTKDELVALIKHLRPDVLILPEGALQKNPMLLSELPDSIALFFPTSDLPKAVESKNYGVYLTADDSASSLSTVNERLLCFLTHPCYVAGDLSLFSMMKLKPHQALFVETDRIASDALQGNVYCAEGLIALQDAHYRYQMTPIDANCQCATCRQQFTRAYFHHLLSHTPLLCQRFLVHHNVYYCQSRFITSFTKETNPDIMSR